MHTPHTLTLIVLHSVSRQQNYAPKPVTQTLHNYNNRTQLTATFL